MRPPSDSDIADTKMPARSTGCISRSDGALPACPRRRLPYYAPEGYRSRPAWISAESFCRAMSMHCCAKPGAASCWLACSNRQCRSS
jgi:hypothetical protein